MELPNPPLPNPNLINRNDGISKLGVDANFQLLSATPAYLCIVCRQAAIFRMIPKSGSYSSYDLEAHGYVCQYCTRYLDSNIYALMHVSKLSM